MTFCNGLDSVCVCLCSYTSDFFRFFLAALARRENIRECLTSVTPSAGGSRVDKDLLVVLTCRDGLLVGVSGVATASPAGVLKAGRARVEPRGVSAGTASRGASAWANPWPGVVPEGVGDVQRGMAMVRRRNMPETRVSLRGRGLAGGGREPAGGGEGEGGDGVGGRGRRGGEE